MLVPSASLLKLLYTKFCFYNERIPRRIGKMNESNIAIVKFSSSTMEILLSGFSSEIRIDLTRSALDEGIIGFPEFKK